MKQTITSEKLPNSEIKMEIEVNESEFKKHEDHAFEEVSKKVQIKGFRPGHIPHHVLKENVNMEAVMQHAMDLALNESYREAVISEKLTIISHPKIDVKGVKPLKYTVTVAIAPEVSIKTDKISIKLKKEEVKDKDVEEVLTNLRKEKGTWKDVSRKAKNGDRVELDFQGYLGTKVEVGKEAANTKSVNHPLILGSKTFIPGFEEEIVEMSVGEEKVFTVTFPKEYHVKEFCDAKITFKVKLGKLEEQTLAELTDEFVKELTGGTKKDLSELKSHIKEVLEEKKAQESKIAAENELIEKLLENAKLSLSELAIEEESNVIMKNFKADLEKKGLTLEKHLSHVKKTESEIAKEAHDEAEKRLKVRFIFDHIIAEEKLKVEDDDIQKELKLIKSRYPEKELSKIDEYYAEGGEGMLRLKNGLIIRKIFDKFISE